MQRWMIAAGLIGCLLLAGARAGAEDEAGGDAALVIDGTAITWEQLAVQFAYACPEQCEEVIDNLVIEHAVRRQAEARGIRLSEEEIADRMEFNIQRIEQQIQKQQPELTLDSYLSYVGKSRDEFLSELRMKVTEQLRAEYLLAPEILNDDRMRVHVIQCKTMDDAKNVLQKLVNGGDFELLAAEYSQDESTRERGGLVGRVTKGLSQFYPEPPPYVHAVQRATGDGIADIIESPQGYFIVRISEYRARPALSEEERIAQANAMVRQASIADLEMNLFLRKIRKSVKVDSRVEARVEAFAAGGR